MDMLVIVAFGDSLTVGYRSPTREDPEPVPAPYTSFLRRETEKLLGRDGASLLRVEFVNRGIVGELTEEMLDRFDRDVLGPRPDVVIILGGSNDLGWGVAPRVIAENLQQLVDGALESGIQPVTCTVPSVLGFDEGIRPRLELNGLIKEQSLDHGVVCVDLFAATSDSAGRLRDEYSNDGLHLSALGYEAMAEAIFSGAVNGIVSKRLASGPDT